MFPWANLLQQHQNEMQDDLAFAPLAGAGPDVKRTLATTRRRGEVMSSGRLEVTFGSPSGGQALRIRLVQR